jgi:hypothetical protein
MWSTLAALLIACLRAAPPLLRALDDALAARRQREKDARVDAAIAQANAPEAKP